MWNIQYLLGHRQVRESGLKETLQLFSATKDPQERVTVPLRALRRATRMSGQRDAHWMGSANFIAVVI